MTPYQVSVSVPNAIRGERTRQVSAYLDYLLERGELGYPLPPERYLAVMFSCSRVTVRRALASHAGCQRVRGRGTFPRQGPPITGIGELIAIAARHDVIVLLTQEVGSYLNSSLAPFLYSLYLALGEARPETKIVIARAREALSAAPRLRGNPRFKGFVVPGYEWSLDLFESAYRSRLPFASVGRCAMDVYWNVVDLSWEDEIAKAMADITVRTDDRVLILGQRYSDTLDHRLFHGLLLQHLDRSHVLSTQIEFGDSGVFEPDGYFATRRYISKHGIPTVILADSDLAAAGAYRALSDHVGGVGQPQIGRDIRILGAGNFLIGQYLSPTLSTFDFNRPHLAAAILEMLAEQEAGKRLVGLRRVSVSYVPRRSTAVRAQ